MVTLLLLPPLPSHHVRAMAEELAAERGELPLGSDKSDTDMELFRRKAETRPEEFGHKYDVYSYSYLLKSTNIYPGARRTTG